MSEVYIAVISLLGGSVLVPMFGWLKERWQNKSLTLAEDRRDWKQLYIEKEKDSDRKDLVILELSTKLAALEQEVKFLKEKYGA